MNKSFIEFIKDKYRNCKYPLNLNSPIVARLDLANLFKEDIEQYQKYLRRIEELKSIPKYAL